MPREQRDRALKTGTGREAGLEGDWGGPPGRCLRAGTPTGAHTAPHDTPPTRPLSLTPHTTLGAAGGHRAQQAGGDCGNRQGILFPATPGQRHGKEGKPTPEGRPSGRTWWPGRAMGCGGKLAFHGGLLGIQLSGAYRLTSVEIGRLWTSEVDAENMCILVNGCDLWLLEVWVWA